MFTGRSILRLTAAVFLLGTLVTCASNPRGGLNKNESAAKPLAQAPTKAPAADDSVADVDTDTDSESDEPHSVDNTPAKILAATTPPAAADEEKAKDNDKAQLRNAKAFDQYLLDRMTVDESEDLLDTCHANPGPNVFCYSVLNRDMLDRKARAHAVTKNILGHGAHTVRARFRKHKIVNWLELRFSGISPLIRGMATTKPSELLEVKKRALAETQCPNNAAIAVAATLEDQLREGLAYDEVATLYLRGGDCLLKSPADRENLVTRAGLLYFAKKQYKTAATVLAKAAGIEGGFSARPLYWLYRARTEAKEPKAAKEALAKLRAHFPFSFHTLIAMTAAGKDPGEVLSHPKAAHLTRSSGNTAFNALVEEVEILRKYGFDKSAAKVLDWAVGASAGVEPGAMLYLAELKTDQTDYHDKIALLTDILYKNPSLVSRDTLESYFPKVYFPIFEKHSSVIDPYLLLAIARRESAFRAGAVSGPGARGLLQVMPQTGRRLASRAPNLLDPDTNIEIGAKYINELLQKMHGQIHFALAAYNAGPGKLAVWAERYPTEDPILFIDLIPYRETREYVASVLRNYYWYRRIHKNDQKMTPKRLTEIATKE